MLSWAVTRGPSLVPGDKRLADPRRGSSDRIQHVRRHDPEGPIRRRHRDGLGSRAPGFRKHDPHKGMKKGHLDFELDGEKLKGRWHLVRMQQAPGRAAGAVAADQGRRRIRPRRNPIPTFWKRCRLSAATGRSMDEIAAGKRKVWHSNRRQATSRRQGCEGKAANESGRRAAKPKAREARAPKAAPSRRQAKPPRKPRKRALRPRTTPRPSRARARRRLPDFVPPCLATLSDNGPGAGDWVHEIKFDGYRMQARLDGRQGHAEDPHRPRLDARISRASPTRCAALAGHDAMIDGEIVSSDENGVSDFSALQDDLKNGRHDRMAYYVFDLLHLDGYDLTGAPLIERKRVLQRLARRACRRTASIRFSEHFETDGPTLLKHACELQSRRHHLQAPRRALSLRPQRRLAQDQVLQQPGVRRRRLSSRRTSADARSARCCSAITTRTDLRYAGRVGTGFRPRQERDLSAQARRASRATSRRSRRSRRKSAAARCNGSSRRSWSRSISAAGPAAKLRAAGLVQGRARGQAGAAGGAGGRANAERSAASKPAHAAEGAAPRAAHDQAESRSHSRKSPLPVAGVALTHPDRVYWDDAGVTKQMLAEYYDAGLGLDARRMSPAACWRWCAAPTAQTGQCFFQKHASAGIDAEAAAARVRAGRRQVDRGRRSRGPGVARAGRRAGNPRPRLDHRSSRRGRPAGVRSRSRPRHRVEGRDRRRARGARAAARRSSSKAS